ncbi:MAG: hypothetical protein D6685_01670 [Bacteroidetes bacterium]|nr:MAG: hypothetical protein D6685_01670 [Bacteroidota bacterium]
MSYTFYKVLHLLGVMMVFLALGGALVRSRLPEQTASWKKLIAITHGVGLLVLLVAGFGLLARLGVFWPMPAWALLKIVIWLLVGGLIALINRKPDSGPVWWYLTLVLGLLAAYLALYKPF